MVSLAGGGPFGRQTTPPQQAAGGAQPNAAGDRPCRQPDRGDGVHVEWGNPQGPVAAAGLRSGDTVEIKYARGTGEQVVRVTLGEKPAPYGGPA